MGGTVCEYCTHTPSGRPALHTQHPFIHSVCRTLSVVFQSRTRGKKNQSYLWMSCIPGGHQRRQGQSLNKCFCPGLLPHQSPCAELISGSWDTVVLSSGRIFNNKDLFNQKKTSSVVFLCICLFLTLSINHPKLSSTTLEIERPKLRHTAGREAGTILGCAPTSSCHL